MQSSIIDNKNQLSLLQETRSGCVLLVSEYTVQAKNLIKRKLDPILSSRLSTEILMNLIYLPIYESSQSLMLTNWNHIYLLCLDNYCQCYPIPRYQIMSQSGKSMQSLMQNSKIISTFTKYTRWAYFIVRTYGN